MQQNIRDHSHGSSLLEAANLLDRFSTKERFAYYYAGFVNSEKSLVSENVVRIIPRGRILNVGCAGNGVERTLFPVSDYKIFGVDINAADLRELRAKKLYDGLYQANIISLPFSKNSFDIVYLRLVLHHLIYPHNILSQGVAECFRVLKPGGILALVEPNSWHPIGALMNMAHRLGLDMYIHGTDDDVALSPLCLHRIMAPFSSHISTHAVTYSWRRLPISLQTCLDGLHFRLKHILNKMPFFGHTLMMIAHKR
jgi:SAM-dependent methyltransferase